jgi:hypothetical protein
MAEKFNVTGDQYFGITGQILELQRQIRLKGGSPINPELVQLALQDIIEGKFDYRLTWNEKGTSMVYVKNTTNKIKSDNAVLKLISGTETLILDALDGKETLATAKEIFPSSIDGNFKNWGTNKAGIATKKQAVDVHEKVLDGTFAQMFGSLGIDLDKLCLTQSQIKNFCKKHPNWLREDGYATFFLFKVEGQFFVARVYVDSSGLYVCVDRFEYDGVWLAENFHRLVVPRLVT